MKVMCIAGYFFGDGGPQLAFGETYTVKRTVSMSGTAYYVLKEHPTWGYAMVGFIPLSNIDGVKVLQGRERRSKTKRNILQMILAFSSFICWYRLC